MRPIRRILIARDFSRGSDRAAAWGVALGRCAGAELHALLVEVPDRDLTSSFLADAEAVHHALRCLPSEGAAGEIATATPYAPPRTCPAPGARTAG